MKYSYVRTYETKDKRGGFIHPIMSSAQPSISEIVAKRIVEELNRLATENERLRKTTLSAIQNADNTQNEKNT